MCGLERDIHAGWEVVLLWGQDLVSCCLQGYQGPTLTPSGTQHAYAFTRPAPALLHTLAPPRQHLAQQELPGGCQESAGATLTEQHTGEGGGEQLQGVSAGQEAGVGSVKQLAGYPKPLCADVEVQRKPSPSPAPEPALCSTLSPHEPLTTVSTPSPSCFPPALSASPTPPPLPRPPRPCFTAGDWAVLSMEGQHANVARVVVDTVTQVR